MSFDVEDYGLKRITATNIIAGKNNSGRTCILHLLCKHAQKIPEDHDPRKQIVFHLIDSFKKVA